MQSDTKAAATAHITASTPLIPAINAWKNFLTDHGRSRHTVNAFKADVTLLTEFLPPDRTLGAISTQDLERFLHWLQNGRGRPCSPKSLARRVTSIKAFFRWLHQGGVLIIDPAEKIVQQSVISPLPTVLEAEEIEAVMQAAESLNRGAKPDPRPLALVSLLLTTGIKKGECLAISANHLDLEAPNGAFLFVRYTEPRNRYKERKIPLTPELVKAYQEYAAQYHITDQVFPWSPRRLEYLLEELGQTAGLNKHLSFDMCRWTCALVDWRSG
ncbi:MAG TPA: site-specific integrase, partial [Anaerolineaceae bacterium]|nr:site-specific integrase [Anaerolineaceae bacterium]